MGGLATSSPEERLLLGDQRVRRTAVELASRARADWSFASSILAAGFRESRLGPEERRLVAEAVYGQIRFHRLIDHLLTQGLRPQGRSLSDLPSRERDLARYLTWLVISEHASPEAVAAAAPERLGRVLRGLAGREETLGRIRDPRQRLGVELSYPDWMVDLLSQGLGLAETRELCAAMNRRAPLTVRANAVKITREQLTARLHGDGVEAEPTSLAPHGLHLTTRVNVFGLKAFREGLFEVQDEGSQLVAEVCAPPPRGVVVDACAGAGGKTLALGALAGGRGRVVALDIDGRKLTELRRRARRAGLSNVQARETGPEPLLELAGRAHRVLCDVPCSGLGVLRRNPEARWRTTAASIEDLPSTQRAILERYAPLCAPGGRLIYATCTVVRGENDGVVEGILADHPELELVPVKEILGGERARAVGDGTFLRLYPHVHGTDGFFAAVMRSRGEAGGGAT